MSFTKKLHTFLNEANTKGVVDQETKQKLQNFADNYEQKSILSFLNAIGFFGGAAIILGLILLVSHNWNQIPNLLKISTYLATLTAFHIAAYSLREKNQKISRILYFISAGYVLAGIGLIAQIYHLHSNIGTAYLIWFIMILPMALLLRDGWIGTLAMLSFYLWVNINANLNFYDFGDDDKSQLIYITALLSSMVLLPKTFTRLKDSLHHIKLIGYISLAIMTLTMGFSHEILSKHQEPISLHPITITILLFNAACLLYNLLQAFKTSPKFSDIIQLPETLIIALTLAAFLIFPNHKLTTSIFYWAIWFWGSALMIYRGELERSRGLINTGTWCVMIGLIARFIDLVGTMLFTGSMFILFGLTLIAVAFGAEKYRKGLINKIFPHHAIQK